MIKSLLVKNYILVDEIKVRFNPGLNIITGETGAGKSIIVNAIGQLCGERGSPEMVRSGTKKAIIEAEIDLKNIRAVQNQMNSLEIEVDKSQSIIIRKELNANGSSRIFINDSPLNLAGLNSISTLLFDFHGQHQHQRLLNPDNHIGYLDSFGSLSLKVQEFASHYAAYGKACKQRDELKARQLKAIQMQDMYRYQNEELQKASLQENELEELKAEFKILSNIETLHQHGRSLTELLYSGELNASDLIGKAANNLQILADLDEQFKTLKANLEIARTTVEEIGRMAEEYLANLEFDQSRMDFIQQRMVHLEFLLKKYQKLKISELITLHQEVQRMLGHLGQYDDEIKQKEIEIEKIKTELIRIGSDLSGARLEVGKRFEERITLILKMIGMPHAQFKLRHDFKDSDEADFEYNGKKISAGPNGFDRISFEISSNAGENFFPLHKIASGGEISRIMLAIKSVLADADELPVLIFDEVDAGISGKIAQIVGKNIFDLSKYHQIICVTHLPQIAAFASAHYRVAKRTEKNHTNIHIGRLDEEEQIQELAHLLGGEIVSRQALENARHLLSEARQAKSSR